MQRLLQRASGAPAWPPVPGMPPLLHELLIRRGVSSAEEAEAFLHPHCAQLHDPFLLSDMDRAARRVLRALEEGQKVCVYGDYDVDGISASALLSSFLRDLGMDVMVYIPSRHEEGYGLNEKAMRELAQCARLLITVDCGVSSRAEVALAQSLGLDVIVTDHHRPGESLPECPVVNPLLNDYPFPSLCGAGVALKLAMALAQRLGDGSAEDAWARCGQYADLAALATVADIVPLTGENRVIVSLGLERVNQSPRPGLAALIRAASLEGKTITATSVAFQLAPRLNASGRLGDAMRAMDLLVAPDEKSADPIARELEAENTNRRSAEQHILGEALAMMEEYDLLEHKVILLVGRDWNSGVIGLAASRLVSRYHHPVVLLAEKDGVCTGSCRSIPGADIFAALSSCSDLMTRFGGHKQAAGLTIDLENVARLRQRLDQYMEENVSPEDYVPQLEYDLELPLGQIDRRTVETMDLLQPTGFGNPAPVLLSRAAVVSARSVGREGAHLQLRLEDGGCELGGILFGGGSLAGQLSGDTRSFLHVPRLNVWRDQEQLQCEVRAILPGDAEGALRRFEAKYPQHLRAFLAGVFCGDRPASHRETPVRPASRAEVAEWLRQAPTGTAVAVCSLAGLKSLEAFLREEGLMDRFDVCPSRWPEDERCFNALCLCPAEPPFLRYRHTVLWDGGEDAFPALPPGDIFRLEDGPSPDWARELPDVHRLRQIYVAARSLTRTGPLRRATPQDAENDLARAAGGGWIETVAALAALRSMGLISPERDCLALLPPRSCQAEDDKVFQKIARLKEPGAKKG